MEPIPTTQWSCITPHREGRNTLVVERGDLKMQVDTAVTERARALIATQIGPAARWARINDAIWAQFAAQPTGRFGFSQVEEIAAQLGEDVPSVFVVLSLLMGAFVRLAWVQVTPDGQEQAVEEAVV